MMRITREKGVGSVGEISAKPRGWQVVWTRACYVDAELRGKAPDKRA